MIERYIYAVTQKLPPSQREDIAQELHGLIEDMLEERVVDRNVTSEDIEDVLIELGDPVHLATQYRGTNRYLIGPALFESYQSILKITLFAVTIAVGVVFVLQSILDPYSIIDHLIELISSLFNAGVHVFAWVTVGFAIAEYKGAIPARNRTGWKPSDLSPIPADHTKQIKRGEAITGVVFSIVFLVFVSFSNHLIGVPVFENNEFITIIPLFNQETITQLIPLILVIIALGLVKDSLKLIIGKWTKKLAYYIFLINALSVVLAVWLLNNQTLFNPSFIQEITFYSGLAVGSEPHAVMIEIWESSTISILTIFIFILIIDTVTTFFKAYKK